MEKGTVIAGAVWVFVILAGNIRADSFGTGQNQFDIDFVPISGKTNPDSGYGSVSYDYRMGIYEITNGQWSKFCSEYGTPSGDTRRGYIRRAYWRGDNIPANCVSWYEAAQFVNYLNISTGHHAAYNFTGTKGQADYTFSVWDPSDAWGGTNLYRHKDAYYFLPTEDEWVKAAYWNGATIQTWATINDRMPAKGIDSNYGRTSGGPWNVGSGSTELNGTYDMMGNVFEWIEDSWYNPDSYPTNSSHVYRGGSLTGGANEAMMSQSRYPLLPDSERPHQALDNTIIEPPPQGTGEVVCQERLGGLLKFYKRAA